MNLTRLLKTPKLDLRFQADLRSILILSAIVLMAGLTTIVFVGRSNASDMVPVACTNGNAIANVQFLQGTFPADVNLVTPPSNGLLDVQVNFDSGLRYQDPANCTGGESWLTGEVEVNLPTFLEIVSLDQTNPYVTSMSSSGNTVSIRLLNGRHPQVPAPAGTRAFIKTRLRPDATNPVAAPLSLYSIAFTAQYATQGSSAVNYSQPVGLLYTKLDVTSKRTEPVGPGDEIEYQVTTRQYPHFTTTTARFTAPSPANTDFVVGSLQGSGGTVVTQTESSIVIDFGQNPGTHSFKYRVKVRPTLPTNAVEIIHFPTYAISVRNDGFNGLPPRTFSKTEGTQNRIPIKATLKLEWVPGGTTMALNGELPVKVKLTNLSTTTAMTNARLGTRTFQGEGLASFVTPEPAGVDLAPGESKEIVYRLSGTRVGKFKISAPGAASSAIGSFGTLAQLSPELCVGCADVELALETPGIALKVGDNFPVKVKVTSNLSTPTTITFVDPVLKEVPADGLPANSILTIEPPNLPAPFELTPADRTRTFIAAVRANKLGVSDISSSLSFTTASGQPQDLTSTRKIEVSPLSVTVQITPRNSVLNQTPDTAKTERCREIEAVPIIGPKNCIEIVATVKNTGTLPITNVRISEAADPIKMVKNTNPKIFGKPLRLIETNLPVGQVDLDAGAEMTWTWRLSAYDGPADLEFVPVAYGVLNGAEISGSTNKPFKIAENVLLKWGMRPTDGRTSYPSGQPVQADGYIENVSMADGGEEKLLRVMVYQIPEKNVGGGFVYSTGEPPSTYQFFDLPGQGEGKRVSLRSLFQTSRSMAPTSGRIRYGVNLWVVGENGWPERADGQALLDDEGYTDEFFVFLSPEEIVLDQYHEECLEAGYLPIFCSFNEGVGGPLGDGIFGLWQFGYGVVSSLDDPGELHSQSSVHDSWKMALALEVAINDSEEAKRLLTEDAYRDYQHAHNLGVLFEQLPGQVALTAEEFNNQTWDSVGKFLQDVENQDVVAVQEKVGYFLGSNPDLFVEPLAAGRTFWKLQRSLARAGEGIAENALTAKLRAEGVQRAASLEARIAAAEANPNVVDLASALESGDVLNPKMLIKVFGVDSKTLTRLHDFARENKVILAFRSRSDIAQSLLNRNLAWPKPQALKHKTVNQIDQLYLGYRNESKGILEIVEPPAGIKGKTPETGLSQALDEHMQRLVDAHPELRDNHVLRFEVRERLETRANEWNKYCPQLQLSDVPDVDSTVKVGVNFDSPMQSARDVSGDIAPIEYRPVTTRLDGTIADATGEQRRVWTLEMGGPNGQPARAVTGDIDFLAILDPQGRFIKDQDKREAIYKALTQMGLMEHGESMSFRLNEPRLEHLSCCIEGRPGSEGMMTIGPWAGPPRVGRFVDNQSVMNDFNAAFKRVRRTGIARDKAGEIDYDEFGRPRTITYRMEDTTGEYALINGIPQLQNAGSTFVRTFTPLLFENVYEEFRSRIKRYFPGLIAIRLLPEDEFGKLRGTTAPSGTIFLRGGPVLQLESVSEIDLVEPSELMIWTQANGWQPVTRKEAIAAGEPGLPDMAPFSFLRDNAAGGSTRLDINSLSTMQATGDFFAANDWIVLDPGGPNQEVAMIASMDPLTLAEPLQLDHKVGEMVAWIEPPAASATVSGRLLTPNRRGVKNELVTISHVDGFRRTARTNTFGYFAFVDVIPGRQYTIIVESKRYEFDPRQVTVNGDLSDVELIALP